MQTFLPFADFTLTAKCLDTRRLGKQLIEAHQIYDILFKPEVSKATTAQRHHPIVNLWRHWPTDSQRMLGGYIRTLNYEWNRRFHCDHASAASVPRTLIAYSLLPDLPEAFYFAHRMSLLTKNRCHYVKYFHLDLGNCINPLWYHHPTKRWYTGRLSAPDTLFMWPSGIEPTVEDWITDCKRRGLFEPRPKIVSKFQFA